jgi:Replication initiator protein, pSAM2
VVARAADLAEYARWAEQVAGTGYCRRPVRLSGEVEHVDTSSGELRGEYSTGVEPDGVILKACGTRRASRCESCARTYRYDAYHLIGAGLRGGKGVPATVAGHPLVFVTFTAPSFGQVHVRREQGGTVYPCHAGRLGERCQHGRRVGCWHRHEEGDPVLGLPLCLDCYDYQAAVIWNAMAPELWRRTTISIARALARLVGMPRSELAKVVRVSYVKVAEFQRRGQVHYHAIIRLDGLDAAGEVVTPPGGFTVDLLVEAIRAAAAGVRAPIPAAAKGGWDPMRWAGASSSTSGSSAGARRPASCQQSGLRATSPSTPPRPRRRSGRRSTGPSRALGTWRGSTCPTTRHGWFGPAGCLADGPSSQGSGYGGGRTCWATEATS